MEWSPEIYFGAFFLRGEMITKEVNEWLRKVEMGNYSSWDIMEEFANF